MPVLGTVVFTGRIKYAPPVPTLDSSMNPQWLGDVLEQMPISQRQEYEPTLTSDGATTVDLAVFPAGANVLVVKVSPQIGCPPTPSFPSGISPAPSPITVQLTGNAGTLQSFTVDGLLVLFSATYAYTAMTIARATGVQTTVRIQAFAIGSG